MKRKILFVLFLAGCLEALALAQDTTNRLDQQNISSNATVTVTNSVSSSNNSPTNNTNVSEFTNKTQEIEISTTNAPPSPTNILEAPQQGIEAESTESKQETMPPDITVPSEMPKPAETNIVETEAATITFEEAPLFDVLKTLRTLAGINFMFDPKIIVTTNIIGPDNKSYTTNFLVREDGRPHSLVFIHLENVTPMQALLGVLDTYGYALIQETSNSIPKVSFKPPKGQEPLYSKVIQLQYASPSNVISIIKTIFPSPPSRCSAVQDPRTSQLVVTATERELTAILELIEKLDTPTKQILIEARLLETSRNPQTIRGIDWSSTLQGQNVSFGNGLTKADTTFKSPGKQSTVTLPSGRTITTTEGVSRESTYQTTLSPSGNPGLSLNTSRGFSPDIAFLNADGLNAVLSFLNKDSDTEVVATPRAVTLDNETAILSVTRAYPIFQITPGAANVPGGSQVQYTNLGSILTVTPRISGSNNISLKVVPEVSNIDSKDQQTIGGQLYVANIYAIRKIETHVLIPSGNTLVMGGLINDTLTKASSKVPILGDLPGIGLAFRHKNNTRLKQNLIIFITPTIISDSDFMVVESNFLTSKTNEFNRIKESEVDKPESFMDSTKPLQWHKSSDKNKK